MLFLSASPDFHYFAHHFFGMLVAERRLVRDVKDGDGALLTVCKFGCAAREQLLGTIQKNVCGDQ